MRTSKRSLISRPIARTEGLLVEAVGGDTVIYDLDTKQVHCLKELAGVVFALADGSRTAADLSELASYRLGHQVSETDVNDAVAQLEQTGLVNASPLLVRDGVSRRDALKTFAVAGAGAALITTIAAPTALAAGSSNIATGSCCGNSATSNCAGLNPTCASGHCCQNNGGKQCNQCKCVGAKNDCEVLTKSQVDVVCTSNSGCPTGYECINPGANGYCCTVIESNGQNLNC